MSNITAIIVTHNSEAYIEGCLDSLVGHGCKDIIVVDNASTDRSAQLAESKNVLAVRNNENVGFAAAANIGARHARGTHILFINPDSKVVAGELKDIDLSMRGGKKAAIMGLCLVDQDGSPEQYGRGDSVRMHTLLKKRKARPITSISNAGWVSGGAMVVRRDAFTALKGFDESFFMYWEDVDLCKRAWDAGMAVLYNPDIVVEHVRGASFGSNWREKTRAYDLSADRYFQKHYATPIWVFQWILRRMYRLLFSWGD